MNAPCRNDGISNPVGSDYNRTTMPATLTEKCAIINADDFGFSEGISRGIVQAHLDGLVTSTTMAANMPAAAGCVGMLRDLPRLGVGLHLNCTQGPALSSRGKAELAGPDGTMNFTAAGIIRACIRHPALVGAVEAEFDAQIHWALEHGLKPTHVDTHRHSHAFYPIFKAICRLCGRYDIPLIRRHRERLPGSWPAAPAKQRRVSSVLSVLGWLNYRTRCDIFKTTGTWGVAHTGVIDADWLALVAARLPAGVTEIMVHPGLPSDDLDASATRLLASRQVELAGLCSASVRQAFVNNGVRLINYGDLR